MAEGCRDWNLWTDGYVLAVRAIVHDFSATQLGRFDCVESSAFGQMDSPRLRSPNSAEPPMAFDLADRLGRLILIAGRRQAHFAGAHLTRSAVAVHVRYSAESAPIDRPVTMYFWAKNVSRTAGIVCTAAAAAAAICWY
jgi:hypothetical protein